MASSCCTRSISAMWRSSRCPTSGRRCAMAVMSVFVGGQEKGALDASYFEQGGPEHGFVCGAGVNKLVSILGVGVGFAETEFDLYEDGLLYAKRPSASASGST